MYVERVLCSVCIVLCMFCVWCGLCVECCVCCVLWCVMVRVWCVLWWSWCVCCGVCVVLCDMCVACKARPAATGVFRGVAHTCGVHMPTPRPPRAAGEGPDPPSILSPGGPPSIPSRGAKWSGDGWGRGWMGGLGSPPQWTQHGTLRPLSFIPDTTLSNCPKNGRFVSRNGF